jgi:hypothetical protein
MPIAPLMCQAGENFAPVLEHAGKPTAIRGAFKRAVDEALAQRRFVERAGRFEELI